MNVYTTDKIRNVALLGHSGTGKTSLVESMAYLAGVTKKTGTVEAGNTLSDYDKSEIKRKHSISTSLISLPWDDCKINLLDTPGYFDFVGEVEEAISAADAAIIVISGKNGVEVGTKKAWDMCEKYHLPRMFFVTEMDIDDASFRQVVEDLQTLYGKKIAPFHLPIRQNQHFVGYINVVSGTANQWTKNGEVIPCEIPEYSQPNLSLCSDALMEAVAETSEVFLERYFNGDTFSEAEIRQALRTNVDDGSIVPISMGSNLLVQGIYTLLDDIVKYFPSPDRRSCTGINAKSNEVFSADYDFSKPKSAYVFKTIVDPFIGKYSLIKVNSGVIKTDDILYNHHKGEEEKIGKLYVLSGNKASPVCELHAGDLGALSKLNSVSTTDSLSTKTHPILFIRTTISTPYTCMRYKAKNKGDEDKISQALQKIMAEDLTLRIENDTANAQTLIYGISERHLEIVREKLLEKYKVEILFSQPKVAFWETILGKSDIDYKYKKQSGGHGQYGHVKIRFEPTGDWEHPYLFTQCVVGGAVPKNYFPAVEKGIAEGTLFGPLAAYPVVGIHAELYDGSSHPVDSSEMAFKIAGKTALKEGILKANPVLLEPIAALRVVVPDVDTGEIMGDLNKRHGRVMGMNPAEDGKREIMAELPLRLLFDYGTALRSMTGGYGDYSYQIVKYAQVSSELQEKEILRRKEKVTAKDEE